MTPLLPRRISLGIALPPDAPFTAEGMRVRAVVPGSMAEAAGLAPGDVVRAIDGAAVRSLGELREATRRAASREAITIAAARGGALFEATVRVVLPSLERVAGSEVSDEHVVAPDGARLRTIVTRPSPRAGSSSAHAPRPAVLLLQGIDRGSIAAPLSPWPALARAFAEAGFVTMRVEKRGVGDSDGDEADFGTELGDCAAAWRALVADRAVDPGAAFLFGHSVGGMIAPLLAAEALRGGAPPPRGIAVFGTSATRWLDCLAASTRRQLRLRGVPEPEIEAELRREREAGFHTRTPAYHAQLHARDLGAAWDAFTGPVLVLAGELDMVVGLDEQAAIADRTNARRAGAAEMVTLAATDHFFTCHEDPEASFSAPGRGAFDRIAAPAIAWMRRKLTDRPPLG
jgi:hypothetical protein